MKKPLLRFFYPQTPKEQPGLMLSNYGKTFFRGIFSTIIAIILLSFSANATVYTVSNLNDLGAGSLRQAIISANASSGADIIVFSQSLSGTINSNSLISITDDLTINGNGLVTISGQNTTAIFEISDNSATVKNITIRGLTITNGKGGADGGTAPVDYVLTALYGGISCRESLTLDNVTISNCGGGLSFGTKTTAAGQPNLTVTNSTISGITSKAAFSEGQASGGTSYTGVIFVNNCVFDSNTAGVVFTGGTSITIENSSFTNNVTASYGGGIYINNQNSTSLNSVLIQNVTVTGNTAGSGAGSAVALFNVPASAPVTINNCTIYKNSGNSTNYGTELGYYGVINLTVNNSIIYGGTGSDYGAGASTGNTYTATFNNCVLGVLSNSGTGGTTNYNAATLKNTDPLLAATAAFNGGPVKTLALNSNSPAINLGNATGAPTTDARGFARDGAGGKVDAGAYERAASTFSFTGTTIPPNNTTNAASDGNLALIFGSVVAKGSGTIRVYSAPSTLLNTINVSGSGVSISGNRVNITAGGLPGNTVIYVQADAGAFTANSDGSTATSNAISGTSTFTFTTGTGTAASPSISESGTLAALSTTTGTASSNTSFTVSGANMTAGITVTAPTGFEVSTSASSGFASSITVGAAGTITSTTVYVRLAAADAPNTYSGNVVLSSTGATSVNIATASSTVSSASPAIASTGTLSGLTSTYGAASTSGSFSVSGSNMSAGILVTPPTGYQVSTDNSTFTNTVTVGSSGTIAATTVYIRIASNVAAGTIATGNIVLSSSGATSVNVSQPQSTVNKAALTITANNQTKAYGAALPTLTVGYSGFVNGDTQASLSSQPTLSTTATAASSVSGSPYAIAPSGAADANYTISYVAAILSVTPVSLTITANNQTKVYGAALPTLTASYAGFVNGDTQASLNTPPTLSTTATSASSVAGSPYAINASGAADANYTISYSAGSLAVTQASLTITADNKTKVYGAALPTLTASYAGFVNGDTQASLTTPTTLSTTATSASSVAGSPYTINASGAVDANYTISYSAGSLAVTTAPLAITADDKSKIAGQPNPTLTASYSGFVNGDNAASLTTQPTLTTAATTGSSAGNYPITPSGAVDNNYTISYVAGNLAVGAASPAIASTGTLSGLTSTYGTASTSGSFSVSGTNMSAGILVTPPTGYQVSTNNSTFTNTVTVGSSGTIAATTVYIRIASNIAAGSIAAGNVVLSSSGATSVNVSQPQSTVNKAALTITANNQTKAYGAAVPTLTVGYSGFVNGDTQASLSSQPTLSTTATAASFVSGGPYPIAPSGAADANYTISYVAAILSVTPVSLTITANNQTKVYGAVVPTLTASYAGLVNGDTQASLTTPPTLSTTATAASSVAGSPYAINASGAVDANYTISYSAGSLAVTQASLTITADNKTKVYGAALPTLTAGYAGFVNGDTQASLATQPTLSTTATSASSVAGSPYAINASGAVDANYTIFYSAGSLAVTTAPLTITADDKSKIAGQPNPTLTASYSGFVNGDNAASLTTQPTLTTAATTGSSAGNYPITPSGAVDNNYTISYLAGNLAVGAASPAIASTGTLSGLTSTYGAASTSGSFSVSGTNMSAGILVTPPTGYQVSTDNSTFTNTVTVGSSGTIAATTVYIRIPSNVAAGTIATGNIVLSSSGATSVNVSQPQSTVNKAPLTITANNQTKAYGAALPTLTLGYSGFVNGDTQASLSSQPTLSTTATAASSVSGSPYVIAPSGAADANYTISYVAAILSVTPVSLTITANNQTKVYGAALPTLTASYAGFVNGDTQASLTTPPTLSTTATSASSVAGSPYAINASGAVDANYTISYSAGSLAVTQASLTITADNKTKVYGAAVPTLTASYAGFVNGDTQASLTTPPTLSTTATASSSVAGSPYTITASGAADVNYTISYVAGSLSVTQASLTITADNKTKAYGAAVPTLTASYAGFVNGDTGASLTTQPTLNTTATATSSVAGSPYTITASGAADPNYSISYVAGSLSVTQASLTITADNKTKAYGAALPTLTASYAGFVNGDTGASLTTQPTLSTTATATSTVAGSPYTITASGAADPNYTISYVAGSLSVTQASLTITADNQTKAYGAAVPTLTASYAGFVNGDTGASLTTQPALSTTATATSSVAGSPYTITASGAVDPNYTISYVAGSLSVTQASLTITADNQTKAYGAAVPTLTASYAGFVNGDTGASLTTQPTLSTTATATSSVAGSPYTITASGAADPNYTISYVAGSLTVSQAALTITADNQTKAYGAAVPTLTASYAGFVNGDTQASLTTPPTLSTTATATSSVAGSPYTITASGAVDPNYTISYVAGSLTVSQAALTITADNQTKAYGAAVPTLTASYAGFVNGDTQASLTTPPTLSTTATATSTVAGSPYTITASGAVDPNYTISYVAGSLSVTQASLTITADNKTKAYGAAVPTLTESYAGFVNGDTQASLTTPPTLSTTATATSSVAGSPYTITASGAADPNYTISYVAGSLSVTQASLTITADNQTKAYGAAVPTLTASYAGFVNGDTGASLTTQPTLSTTATATSSVAGSPYTITASGAVDPNYTISYVAGSLSVTQASLTITADNKTKAYGAAVPTLTASYAGFVNGDTQASLTTPPTLSTTATSTSTVAGSPYTITASGTIDPNYTISYVSGSLTVTQAALTVTAANQTKTYGAANPALTVSYAGFVNGDTQASLTTPATATTTATTASAVGNYTIVPNGAADNNYTISYVNGTLTVGQAALTVTADNQTKTYGTANPALTVSYAGFVNGDTQASLTTPATATTTATTASAVGNYTIVPNGAADNNYTISYVNGTLTIGQAALTVTADNLTKTYGAANPALTLSYAGFVNGDTQASLTTPATATTTVTAASAVGNYTITPSGATDNNYTISYVNGTLTIGQADLTVTADNQTKTYGAANPALTVSYSGFVNGDTQASLTTPATATTTATTASAVGNYTIVPGGAADNNYTISYVNGTLTVGQAALTVTAANQTKTYGAANPALTVSYSGFVNGDTQASLTTPATATTTATTASAVGNYTIVPSGAADNNYTISYVNGTLTVGQAALTVIADNQTKTYGAANPALTVSYSGFVNGDTQASLTTPATATTTATTASAVGNYTIVPGGAADNNYTISYVNGTLNVGQAALTVTANNQTKTYGASNPALTVSYSGFVNGDTQASLTTPAIATTTATTASAVGNYTIVPNGAADNNYTISYVNGTLTVGQAALTVTADNQTKTYGAANPALTVSYAGFVNGDTQASLTTPAIATTTATTASAVGNYTIVPSGAADNNYTISYVNGTLNVGQAALTVTANNQTKTYGAANPALTVSYSGFVNGDTQASLTTPATATTTATTASAVGNYTIVPNGAADNNYTISYVNGTLTIGQAALTVTANNQTKTYGAANPALTVSYAGFVNGDTQASLTTPPTATTTATAASAVGNYTIVPGGAANNNYTISYVNGTLTVGQEAIAITADPKTKVYGQTDPALTYTITSGALVGSDAFTGALTRSAGENVGAYAINQGSLALNNNYNLTYTGADLSITPAILTVTANDATRPFGKPNPTLNVSYSGFEESDTPASLTVTPIATTSATQASSPGTYPITANGAASANYTFNYVQGTLTVTPIMNSSLAGLSTTAGAISPAFASGTFSYNVSVGNTVTSTTITPTAADPTQTINVNGSTVASGVQSNSIKLKVGNNAIATVVTAQDGSTTTYTINVSRAPSAIASLDDLTLSNGTLAPIFNTNVSAYTTLIDYTVNSITLTPTPTDPTATITVNGEQVNGGSASSVIPLNVGFNTITVVVTAQDGTTQQTYKLIAERGIAPTTITATNILTPNGDGKNDYWVVKDIELYPNNTVTVFDRAGRIVYTKHNYGNTWDGTFNGSPLNEDTYYYLVDLGIGLPKIKGYVTIVRNRR